MQKNEDEIDLLELLKKIMIGSYDFFTRRYKLLLMAIIIGGFLGISKFLLTRNRFEHTLIGTSYIVAPNVIIDLVNSLQEVNKNNKAKLQEVLDLQPKEGKALLKISADSLRTISNIDNQKVTTIEVKIEFTDNFDHEGFSEKLCSYINSNEFVAHELKLEKQRCHRLINKYDKEIKMIDSLQKSILKASYSSSSNESELIVLKNKPIDFFHKDIIALEKEKELELKKKERITGLYIIDNKIGTSSSTASLSFSILQISGIMLGLALLVCLFLEIKKYILMIKNENSIKINGTKITFDNQEYVKIKKTEPTQIG